MRSTPLSTILSRMDRWKEASNTEEQFKVRDLDSALRELKRSIEPPWTLVKGSLRVFNDVKEYPVASGHDELAYIDKNNIESYADAARFNNTSLQQFMEMVSSGNLLTELWDQGTKMIGIDYKDNQLGSQKLNGAETASEYTGSDDAGTPVRDTVFFKKGNASMRVPITLSASLATIKNTFNSSFVDAKYKSKYHFKWIYLPTAPTSIALRFQVSDSVYLETTGITTQFSGASFKAGQWNLVAHDLNEATEVGSVSTASTWASEKIILTGAATGDYYIDQSDLREWTLMDYWYYSRYFVATVSANVPDQEFFFNSSEVYSTDSELVGDDEWADVIMYDALLMTINAEENQTVYNEVKGRRERAWSKLEATYPSMKPLITTQRYRFNNNPGVSSPQVWSN